MKEFIINEYLSLRLEEEPVGDEVIEIGGEYYYNGKYSLRTNIYIKGKRFRQCKFLLLEIPVEKINSLDEITSIDEASESLDHSEEAYFLNGSQKIPPEVEFWGHCSNLQAWYENDCDTRLIHRNLAFPLLKGLTDAGDPLAKRIFREEIAQRLESGYLPVVSFLFNEDFTYYLPDDYFEGAAQSQKMINILFEAAESKNTVFKFVSLNLFHKLYRYLSDDIIQKFVNFIKQDEEYVGKILHDPLGLTNTFIYYNPNDLYSIRVALILDNMKEQCQGNSKVKYENLKWKTYLEQIIRSSIRSANEFNDCEQKIRIFLKNAFEREGRLTKQTINNCIQGFKLNRDCE